MVNNQYTEMEYRKRDAKEIFLLLVFGLWIIFLFIIPINEILKTFLIPIYLVWALNKIHKDV